MQDIYYKHNNTQFTINISSVDSEQAFKITLYYYVEESGYNEDITIKISNDLSKLADTLSFIKNYIKNNF